MDLGLCARQSHDTTRQSHDNRKRSQVTRHGRQQATEAAYTFITRQDNGVELRHTPQTLYGDLNISYATLYYSYIDIHILGYVSHPMMYNKVP